MHSTQEEKGTLGEAEGCSTGGSYQLPEKECLEGLGMVLAKDGWIKLPWGEGTL